MDGKKTKHCNVHLFCNLCTNTKSGRTNIWEKITCVLACCHYIIKLIIKFLQEFFAFITIWGEMVGNSHPVPLLMIIYWSDDSIQTVPEEVQAREMILWNSQKCEMGKNFKMWKNVSVTDGPPANRIEKIEQLWKEKLLSSNSSTTFIFRVVQFFQFVWLVGRQLLTPCEIFALKWIRDSCRCSRKLSMV